MPRFNESDLHELESDVANAPKDFLSECSWGDLNEAFEFIPRELSFSRNENGCRPDALFADVGVARLYRGLCRLSIDQFRLAR